MLTKRTVMLGPCILEVPHGSEVKDRRLPKRATTACPQRSPEHRQGVLDIFRSQEILRSAGYSLPHGPSAWLYLVYFGWHWLGLCLNRRCCLALHWRSLCHPSCIQGVPLITHGHRGRLESARNLRRDVAHFQRAALPAGGLSRRIGTVPLLAGRDGHRIGSWP